jgi:hypothetical protein
LVASRAFVVYVLAVAEVVLQDLLGMLSSNCCQYLVAWVSVQPLIFVVTLGASRLLQYSCLNPLAPTLSLH